MDTRDKFMIGVSLVAFAAAAIVAWGVPAYGTPGYEYGRINCGPSKNGRIRSQQQCIECCRFGERHGLYAPQELKHCESYCPLPCWSCWFPNG